MTESLGEQLEAAEASQAHEDIERELEAMGPGDPPPNRSKRRQHIRDLHRLALDPGADSRLFQGMREGKLTKVGKARLAKRRAKAKAARRARKQH